MSKFYNNFRLKNSVGNNLANDPDDVMAVSYIMTKNMERKMLKKFSIVMSARQVKT